VESFPTSPPNNPNDNQLKEGDNVDNENISTEEVGDAVVVNVRQTRQSDRNSSGRKTNKPS
jgi:hypothetical protein